MMVLGIDYGRSHVGIATGDTEMAMALPLTTLSGLDQQALFEDLERLVVSYGVEKLVLGIPIAMQGGDGGAMRQEVEEFSRKLQIFECPVILIDERMTSSGAAALRRDTKASSQVDEHAVAAMLILQTYLDQQPKT